MGKDMVSVVIVFVIAGVFILKNPVKGKTTAGSDIWRALGAWETAGAVS